MTDTQHYNDQPIALPEHDIFGIDPFAKSLAKSIEQMQSPTGTVMAINGPWGSGKSSVVNLVKHHLGDAVKAESLTIIDFNCWWFRGEEALALAFFRELYAGLSPSVGKKIKKTLPKIGARLLKTGPAVGAAVEVAGVHGAGAIVSGAMDWLGGFIQQDEGVEKLHRELAQALREQNRRFLVVIDDIDRLTPDEALLIFRLVKSVGRLPNIMYLLAYDRQLAERVVSERFPSEGPHYLEKIVQAAFELPEPEPSDLHGQLLQQMGEICGQIADDEAVRFMNIFYDCVAPALSTPRDVALFTNSLSITWPAVANEVNAADFIGLEVFRLAHPKVYAALRRNKAVLCKNSWSGFEDRRELSKEADRIFLDSVDEQKRGQLRKGLARIFPTLETAWNNVLYGNDFIRSWLKERRACTSDYFDAYFRFALGSATLQKAEIDTLVEKAGDEAYIADRLIEGLEIIRRGGGTKTALILDALKLHADSIDLSKAAVLVRTVFRVADTIDVPAHRARAMGIGSNHLRIHWLVRELLLHGRSTLEERSAIFKAAAQNAPLNWLVDFTGSALRDYSPREGDSTRQERQPLMLEADALALKQMSLLRIEAASADGSLISSENLATLLFRWKDYAPDSSSRVKAWTNLQLDNDSSVIRLAKAFTTYGWSQGLGSGGMSGDYVAQRVTHAAIKNTDDVLDQHRFRSRLEEIERSDRAAEVADFLGAWRRQEARDARF